MCRQPFCNTQEADLSNCLVHWQCCDVAKPASHAFCGICRPQPRPGSSTLAQCGKPSHASKPPPPPPFKAPPPSHPGPPPSAVQPVRSQNISAPGPEPRQNAWERPLAGHRLSQPLDTKPPADVESSVSRGSHMPSHQGLHGSASSGNGGSILESKSDAHLDFRAAPLGGQQEDMAEAAPSSPAQVIKPAGLSSTTAAAAANRAGQYPQESEHEAQIEDLQASSPISLFHGYAVCSWHVAIYIMLSSSCSKTGSHGHVSNASI